MAKNPFDGLNLKALGIPWFRRDNYEAVREMMDDRETFFDTFDEWEKHAERRLAELVPPGIVIEKVIIEPEEFRAFCKAHRRRKIDAEARSAYAAFVAIRRHGRAH